LGRRRRQEEKKEREGREREREREREEESNLSTCLNNQRWGGNRDGSANVMIVTGRGLILACVSSANAVAGGLNR